MKWFNGFMAKKEKQAAQEQAGCSAEKTQSTPRRSVVQVYFPQRELTLAYYNDRFDLHCGDKAYVEGKLEGKIGCVAEVSYSFRIHPGEYKKVIAVADTTVNGCFYMASSRCLTFDRNALPRKKVTAWLHAPAKEECLCGTDGATFRLEDFSGMSTDTGTMERGREYYEEDRVRYLCLDGQKGFALVEGSRVYEVEFEIADGNVRNLTCSCYCTGNCKHTVAAMLELRAALKKAKTQYPSQFARTGYVASVTKWLLYLYAISDKESGCMTLQIGD